ncbi:uncharacterized protein V6R79_004508 [Siganus canaliculatus]
MLGSTETLENCDESLGGDDVVRELQFSGNDSARPPSSDDHTPDFGPWYELAEIRENHVQLEEYLSNLKSRYQQEYSNVTRTLQEETYRCKNLEEQLNDLRELYSNEILNLKEELASINEKILYQTEDRVADVNEVLDACHTRLSKMEQQQQAVHAAADRVTAQTLAWDLLAAVLTFVAAVVNCVLSVTTRSHLLFMLLCVALVYLRKDTLSDLQHYFCTHTP